MPHTKKQKAGHSSDAAKPPSAHSEIRALRTAVTAMFKRVVNQRQMDSADTLIDTLDQLAAHPARTLEAMTWLGFVADAMTSEKAGPDREQFRDKAVGIMVKHVDLVSDAGMRVDYLTKALLLVPAGSDPAQQAAEKILKNVRAFNNPYYELVVLMMTAERVKPGSEVEQSLLGPILNAASLPVVNKSQKLEAFTLVAARAMPDSQPAKDAQEKLEEATRFEVKQPHARLWKDAGGEGMTQMERNFYYNSRRNLESARRLRNSGP
ncbi:MAG: hypothetical protein WDO70_02635 [Alphaproteobacteria bacterium]